MPRERITDEPGVFDVEVAWARDVPYVEIVTSAPDADDRLKRILDENTPDPGATSLFDGWHAHLDRARINQLIRVLRRARDQAFGRDE